MTFKNPRRARDHSYFAYVLHLKTVAERICLATLVIMALKLVRRKRTSLPLKVESRYRLSSY